jgi:hypothetical protein
MAPNSKNEENQLINDQGYMKSLMSKTRDIVPFKNSLERLKLEYRLERLKLENRLERLKLENRLERLKLENRLERLKLENR